MSSALLEGIKDFLLILIWSCHFLFCAGNFYSIYWLYHDSHAYANVLPSEPAAGYLDAGKIVFAEEAHVDAGRGMGFKDGNFRQQSSVKLANVFFEMCRNSHLFAPMNTRCFLMGSTLGRHRSILLMTATSSTVFVLETFGFHSFAVWKHHVCKLFTLAALAQDGSTYCVAPIVDAATSSVQFFAAGIDCCSRGNFECDDAWDEKAHAGLVLRHAWHPQYPGLRWGRKCLDWCTPDLHPLVIV